MWMVRIGIWSPSICVLVVGSGYDDEVEDEVGCTDVVGYDDVEDSPTSSLSRMTKLANRTLMPLHSHHEL